MNILSCIALILRFCIGGEEEVVLDEKKNVY